MPSFAQLARQILSTAASTLRQRQNNTLFLLLLGLASVEFTWAESLYVYVPSSASAKSIQDQIRGQCNNIDVLAFGLSKDFHRQIKKASPGAILTLPPVLSRYPNFKLVNRGEREGSHQEFYYIVSLNSNVTSDELGQHKVALVDVLGRSELKSYLKTRFPQIKRTTRVTKYEDLIALWIFKPTTIALVPHGHLATLQNKSKLTFVMTKTDQSVGLPILAVEEGKAPDNVIACLSSFKAPLNSLFGVEQWR